MVKNLEYLVMEDAWKAPFLYRKRIEEKCRLFDDSNGCYPYENDICADVLNLKAYVNEDRRVVEIDYYKVHYLSCGAGRPQTTQAKLSAGDKKAFSDILENATVSRADQVLPSLLEKAAKTGTFSGWKIDKVTKNAVRFLSSKQETVSIPKKRIEKALEISYSYIDILSNPDFWIANEKVLKIDDREPLLALFSLVDISDYYRRDELIAEAETRQKSVQQDSGYRMLCNAVTDNDVKQARKYQQFAANPTNCYVEIPPLYTALQNRNLQMVRLLLRNGAPVSERFYKDGQLVSILCAAVEQEWDEAFYLCLKYPIKKSLETVTIRMAEMRKRPDYIIALLKKGCTFTANAETLALAPETLASFSKYPGILWEPEHLAAVYGIGNLKAVKQMLASLENPGPHYEWEFPKKEMKEYRMSATRWVYRTQNAVLKRFLDTLDY